jgi:AraC-like DNA-binding protein
VIDDDDTTTTRARARRDLRPRARPRTRCPTMTRARIVRQTLGATRWEFATRAPPDHLRACVQDLSGYSESAGAAVSRREFPGPCVVVILEFGPPIRVFGTDDPGSAERYAGGFVAGLHERHTLTEHGGFQHGIQVNFTPLGARLVFDLPMSELAGRVVHFRDLVPREHRTLAERLAALPDWDARFDAVERFASARIARARARTRVAIDPVAWAYRRILESGGTAEIGALSRELGYSRKHLIALFRDQVGVPPKLVARIVRFDRLVQHLRRGGAGNWAELAVRFGYYDQAHLARDVQQFTGTTPSDVRSRVVPLAV